MKMPKKASIQSLESFSSSSASTPSISSSNSQLEVVKFKEDPILCKICGDMAQGHHFGGYSCHAWYVLGKFKKNGVKKL